MVDSNSDQNRRRHRRTAVTRPVRAKSGSREHLGATKDISVGGAALELDGKLEDEDLVELDIENMSPVSGRVARWFDDGFAIEFDIGEDEEARLLAEIAQIHDTIESEEN